MQRSWHHHGTGLNSAAPSPPLGQSPHLGSSFDEKEATPPSPSLLSANADTALLSRRRLRLISRMFVQMCEALQACHDAGVTHRDIKPENIIIVDNRAELGSAGKVVIKITDWGLGTTDERCEDFDCGSKPYMAYECRNNLMPSYEPKGADVWSLGIVLLNLLFHRCPWADPTLDDPDFCAF
ncbi:Pkinase-domain-containing protein, partial [Cystobasidium minutum MCA 4210]|uniref:Pkinase-domain-containing protein n=1 Tax=Cystobasidium minutum MCA 4210 TaxID=1397322 RepID=UPI0034CFE200|eukprot:jgi/Rhomi1/143068/e_gw1.3.1101.1